ncbi:MAG: hypothetical protein K0S54_1744 [Alphaproteobacteria bacterium]|jgi:hypothetical protein|nr:hypothetical protein [Alphaproteobacteria bacterium]
MSWDDSGLTLVLGGEQIHLPVLVIIAFVVSFPVFLFVLLRLARFFGATARPCRWKRMPAKDRPSFVLWQCSICAVEAYSSGRQPPKECKKLLKSGV